MPLSYKEYLKLSKEELVALFNTATEEEKKIYIGYSIEAGKEKYKEENNEKQVKKEKNEYQVKAEKKVSEIVKKYHLSKESVIEISYNLLRSSDVAILKVNSKDKNGKVNTIEVVNETKKHEFFENYKSSYTNQLNRFLYSLTVNSKWDHSLDSLNEMIDDFEELAHFSIMRKRNINVPSYGGMTKEEFEVLLIDSTPLVKASDDSYFIKNYEEKNFTKKDYKTLNEKAIDDIVTNLQKNFSDALKCAKNITNDNVKFNTVMSSISKGYKTLNSLYKSQSWWYKFTHKSIAKKEKDTLNSIKNTCKHLLLLNGNKMNDDEFKAYAVADYSELNYVVLEDGEKYSDLIDKKTFSNLKNYPLSHDDLKLGEKNNILVEEIKDKDVKELNNLDNKTSKVVEEKVK